MVKMDRSGGAPDGPVPLVSHQTSFAGGELSPHLRFSSDLKQWRSGAARLLNMIVLPQGTVANRAGTEFIAEVRVQSQPPRIIPFQFGVTQSYVLEFDDLVIRFFSNGAPLRNSDGSIYEISSPYAIADVRTLNFAQSADVMTICHPAYPPYELRRMGQTNWAMVPITFGATITAPTTVTVNGVAGNATEISGSPPPAPHPYGYGVSTVSQTLHEESNISGLVGTNNYDLGYYPQYGTYNQIQWTGVDGADYYNVYRIYQGVMGFIGSVENTSFQDTNYLPDTANGPPSHYNPFAGGNYPSCVAFYQQRRAFGGSSAQPQTIWMSRSGSYSNMDVRSPTQDDDAITLTIASQQVNQIKSFVSTSVGLVAMTSGGAWTILGGSGSAVAAPPITPSQAIAAPQAFNTGSSYLQPIQIGYDILYVEEKQSCVRDLSYNLYAAVFTGNDLTDLSDHLFLGYQIIAWAYSHSPNRVLWCVRSDGRVLALTYLKEQEIFAWHQHDLGGNVLDVTVVSESRDSVIEDVPYFVVQRVINGQVRCYLERMHTRVLGIGNADITLGWFVDCALSNYFATPQTVIGGLDHLEGQTVSILADGKPMTRIVFQGAVTLDTAARRVTAGIPITAQVLTMPADPAQPTDFDRRKKISRVRLSVFNTLGVQVGPNDANRLLPLDDPQSGVMNTGFQTKAISPAWDNYGQVLIQQTMPLPCTVTGVLTAITFGDEGIAGT